MSIELDPEGIQFGDQGGGPLPGGDSPASFSGRCDSGGSGVGGEPSGLEEGRGKLLADVEILRTGAHTAGNGLKITLTTEDLDRIAGSYAPDFHEAPVVIGHPKDDEPAYGWVKSLSRRGDRLLGVLDLAREFVVVLQKGLFKKRSVSLYPDLDGKGLYLRHVGFLGAVPPAIKALADIRLKDGAESLLFEFKAGGIEPMSWKDLFKRAVDEMPEGGGEGGSGETSSALERSSQMEEMGTVQFSEEDVRRLEEEAARKARAQARLEFAEESKRAEAERAACERKKAARARVDLLVSQGKAAPAWVRSGLAEFVEGLPDGEENVVEFAEGSKKTPREWFLEFLEGLPDVVDLSEAAGRESDPGSGGAAEKLDLLTKAKMASEKGLTYALAFSEVQAEHPDLAREYGAGFRG